MCISLVQYNFICKGLYHWIKPRHKICDDGINLISPRVDARVARVGWGGDLSAPLCEHFSPKQWIPSAPNTRGTMAVLWYGSWRTLNCFARTNRTCHGIPYFYFTPFFQLHNHIYLHQHSVAHFNNAVRCFLT
jgi:hypothetical protein